MPPLRILLIDDHAVMRMGLASLLGTQPNIVIVGGTGNGANGIKLAVKLNPDIVITDLLMPEMDGVETTRQLKEKLPDVKVIILTTYGGADGIAHALAAGANGALVKTAELKELLSTIRAVANGEIVIADEIRQTLSNNPPIPELSQRQAEILDSITRGLTNEDIAKQLGLQTQTVKEYLGSLFMKIGAANRAEAVAIAMRKHLLKV